MVLLLRDGPSSEEMGLLLRRWVVPQMSGPSDEG